MTLGELLQGMGPGQVGGYPQMAPPPGIPWQQPVPPQPAPAAQPVARTVAPSGRSNAGMTNDNRTMQRTASPQTGGYSTPQAMADISSLFNQMLEGNRARWAEEDRQSYEDARGAENTRPAPTSGSGLPPDFDAFGNNSPAPPSAPRASAPGSVPAQAPADYDAFGNYTGAGAFTSPLAAALYPDTEVPLPEKGMRSAPAVPASAATPSRQKDGGGSTPSRTGAASPATAPRSNTSPTVPSSTSSRRSSFQEAPYGEGFDPYRGRENTGKNDMARFFLQAGLSLMVPQWGGPVAQIGKAIGEGAEAVGRGSEIETKDRVTQQKMDLDAERVRKIGLGRKGASESSSSKKLKKLTPMQALSENLAPEASLYFNQRMKDLNKVGEADVDDKGNSITHAQKYENILNETKRVDARARMGRGQLKSEEIPDKDIAQAAADPTLEGRVLNWVQGDPVQRQLTFNRLQAAKAKANGGTGTKPNG